jgi:hypothetical protein
MESVDDKFMQTKVNSFLKSRLNYVDTLDVFLQKLVKKIIARDVDKINYDEALSIFKELNKLFSNVLDIHKKFQDLGVHKSETDELYQFILGLSDEKRQELRTFLINADEQ